MEISNRTQELGTENSFEVLSEVNQLKNEGKDIVNFCIGQPDFDTPQHIKDAAITSIREGKTGYTDSAGIFPAREAVARYISRTRGIEANPDHVVIGNGSKHFIAFIILCTTDFGVGDEVIYPNPGYPIYESQIIANGAVPVPLPLTEKMKFSFKIEELEKRITRRTKLLILNTPQNPTGGVLEQSDLVVIAELAKKHDIWVFADEIYCQIIYEKKFASIASLSGMYERTIICDGLSKAYAMTGWRMGYMVNPVLAPRMARWITNTEACPNHMAQYALIAALNGSQDETKKMVAIFKERRNLIVKLLNEIKDVHCHTPGGAFYVFPNVTAATQNLGLKDAEALRKYLLQNGVSVLADTHFGNRNPGETEQYIRLSYATSKQNIVEGLARMKKLIEGK